MCEEFPAHVVSAWLGNSVVVAQSHYLQILDKHFEAAVGEEPRKNVAQNPAQSGAELVRTASQPTCGESSQAASVQRDTAPCETVPFPEVTPWGFEQPQFPTGNTAVSETGGNRTGNTGAGFGPMTPPATPPKPTDPELAAVVAAWPDLPAALRAGIVAMVAAAAPAKPAGAEGGR